MPAFHMERSLLVLPIQMFSRLCFRWYLIRISNCTCWLEQVVKDTSSIWMQLVMKFSTTKIKQTAPKMISWKLWLGSIVSRAVIHLVRSQEELNWSHWSYFSPIVTIVDFSNRAAFRWWRSRTIGKIHHSHVRKTTYTWHITQWLTWYMLYCQKSGKSSLELLPPWFNVFQQHCKWANYQTYIWRQCFNPMMKTDKPTDHWWRMGDGKIYTIDIQWMTCNPAPDEAHIIKQKIHIYTYAFLSLNHHIKFILVFYRLCRFSNSYLATTNVPVVKIVFVS